MKFAHLGDCHLGGWRFPELQELNMLSFSRAIEICIKEKVDIVLIAGDLFDSAYPSIETLKETFQEFRKLSEAKIPCFLIAGSHDYSASGKTFLDVLEKAGFCTNVSVYEERGEDIILHPTVCKNYAIYGYPGKKSGLEVPELRRIKLQESPGFFNILMLHTSIKEALGRIPVDSISINQLPKADYYALGHLHINFATKNLLYSGPIFPNNFEELEELEHGQFYIVENKGFINPVKIPLKIKEIKIIEINLNSTLGATEKIISEINQHQIEDKVVLLKLYGNISDGKPSEIKFNEIESFVKTKKPFSFIKNTSKLLFLEENVYFDSKDIHHAEEDLIEKCYESVPEKFKETLHSALKAMNIEKNEDETNLVFQDRLIGELKAVFKINEDI
jgi:DNA repair protein SbcD/Mre11